jgi:hypothetical protein
VSTKKNLPPISRNEDIVLFSSNILQSTLFVVSIVEYIDGRVIISCTLVRNMNATVVSLGYVVRSGFFILGLNSPPEVTLILPLNKQGIVTL